MEERWNGEISRHTFGHCQHTCYSHIGVGCVTIDARIVLSHVSHVFARPAHVLKMRNSYHRCCMRQRIYVLHETANLFRCMLQRFDQVLRQSGECACAASVRSVCLIAPRSACKCWVDLCPGIFVIGALFGRRLVSSPMIEGLGFMAQTCVATNPVTARALVAREPREFATSYAERMRGMSLLFTTVE